MAAEQRAVGALRWLWHGIDCAQDPEGPRVAILQHANSWLPSRLRRDSCCRVLVVPIVRTTGGAEGGTPSPRAAKHVGRDVHVESRRGPLLPPSLMSGYYSHTCNVDSCSQSRAAVQGRKSLTRIYQPRYFFVVILPTSKVLAETFVAEYDIDLQKMSRGRCGLCMPFCSVAPCKVKGFTRFDDTEQIVLCAQKMSRVPGPYIAGALIPAILIVILFYFDHTVSAQMAQLEEFGLQKPPAYHYDLFLLGWMTLLCGLIGIPPVNGVLPQVGISLALLSAPAPCRVKVL